MNPNTLQSFAYLDKKKGTVGAAFATAVFLICCIWYSWQVGLFFGLAFLAVGFLKFRVGNPWAAFALNALAGIACIFLSCILPTVMVTDLSYFDIGIYRVVMNFLCAAIVYGICLAVTGCIRSAVITASGLLLLLSTVNAFVFQFRGNELKPMDILSVGTALNVIGQYSFQIPDRMAYSWMLWLLAMSVFHALPEGRPVIPKRWFRLAAAGAAVLCFVVFWHGSENIRTWNWSNEGTTRNGYLLNFAVGIRDSFVQEPENYSADTIEGLEAEYSTPESQQGQELPNIIVIMNESYADFGILGNELRTNQPVTPFLDSLTENTIKGYALTSIFGGTTANSEFEFLTGFSMANLPEGSVPYQQYLTGEIYSLAQLLNSYGYKTFATHPYFSSGWNRTQAYPRLGFSEMTFDEDYPYEDLIREFVSDREMYDYVLNALDQQTDAPLFLFGITMQNHGDYIYTGDNYEQTIFLEGYEMDHPMAEQYLSLLHASDKAVEYLLTELEEYPEDTVVLFFGDHFPQVEGDFFLEVHGGEYETLSEQMLQYTVPFFVWANFDIPEQTVECTSLNYLGRYLLEAAGIDLPPYYRFLSDMEQAIPSLNAHGYYSLSQQTYLPLAEAEGEEALWLNRYAIVQYNGMFDRDGRSDVFFAAK